MGMTTEQCQTLLYGPQEYESKSGLGIALKNINARLTALHGPDGGLQILSGPKQGTVVFFKIPFVEYGHQNLYN
jgi:two-component system sensor histidine kinase LytS